ncbi:MAG: hypothetical protein JNL92_16565 [Opitutaceae bacterium]|nr:hypothetical protein [Opitutaceae bacterium]
MKPARPTVVYREGRRTTLAGLIRWVKSCAGGFLLGGLALATDLPAAEVDGSFALTAGTSIRFASVEQGREVLGRRDAFITALSPWDRQARLRTDRDVSSEEFLAFVTGEVLAWEPEERTRLAAVLEQVRERLRPWPLRLPREILFVLTTGREEGGAAYCREQTIVLPRPLLGARGPDKTQTGPRLERLVLHELFHILSAHDRALRDRLYRSIGFTRCGEVALPEDVAARRITNPDAPIVEHAIEIELEGKPVSVVPILLADAPRYPATGGRVFFRHLQFRLLVVEPRRDGGVAPRLVQGAPQWVDPGAAPGYHEKIGRNTDYIIHPEEVLADNFALLLLGNGQVNSPHVLDGMRRILLENEAR